MSVKSKLQVKTEVSTLDFENLYINVDEFPKPNSIYFNFTIDGGSNGFHILYEDWVKITNYIKNEIEKNKLEFFNKQKNG